MRGNSSYAVTCEGVSWRKKISRTNGWSLPNEEERDRYHVRPERWLVQKDGLEGRVSPTGCLKTLSGDLSWGFGQGDNMPTVIASKALGLEMQERQGAQELGPAAPQLSPGPSSRHLSFVGTR